MYGHTTGRALGSFSDPSAVAGEFARHGQALGMSVNLVGLGDHTAFAANVEVAGYLDRAATTMVDSNGSHTNGYKHLSGVEFSTSASSAHRQAAADCHAPPRTRADVLAIIGDEHTDPTLPVYRANHTMHSVLFDSSSGGRFQAS